MYGSRLVFVLWVCCLLGAQGSPYPGPHKVDTEEHHSSYSHHEEDRHKEVVDHHDDKRHQEEVHHREEEHHKKDEHHHEESVHHGDHHHEEGHHKEVVDHHDHKRHQEEEHHREEEHHEKGEHHHKESVHHGDHHHEMSSPHHPEPHHPEPHHPKPHHEEHHHFDEHDFELQKHHEHLAYIADFKCHEPQKRVVPVHLLLPEEHTHGKAFFPDVTVINRCDAAAGCCKPGHHCIPLHSVPVHLFFKVTYLEDIDHHHKGSWDMERHIVDNHTDCGCVDKHHLPKGYHIHQYLPENHLEHDKTHHHDHDEHHHDEHHPVKPMIHDKPQKPEYNDHHDDHHYGEHHHEPAYQGHRPEGSSGDNPVKVPIPIDSKKHSFVPKNDPKFITLQ